MRIFKLRGSILVGVSSPILARHRVDYASMVVPSPCPKHITEVDKASSSM